MSTKTDDRLDQMRRRISELEAKAQAAGEHAKQSTKDHADAKVEQLQTRLESARHALAAEVAEDRQAFSEAMNAYLDDFKELSAKLSERAKTMTGSAREQAEAAISEVGRRRDAVAERVAQAREASGERWRESKASVAAARAELESKADDAIKKLR